MPSLSWSSNSSMGNTSGSFSPGPRKSRNKICSIYTLLAFFIGAVVMFAISRQPQTAQSLGIPTSWPQASQAQEVKTDTKDLLEGNSLLRPAMESRQGETAGEQYLKSQISWRDQPRGQATRRELRNGEATGQRVPTVVESVLPAAEADTQLPDFKADLEPKEPLIHPMGEGEAGTQVKQAVDAPNHAGIQQEQDLQTAMEHEAAGANLAAIQHAALATVEPAQHHEAAEDQEIAKTRTFEAEAQAAARVKEAEAATQAEAAVQAAIQQAAIVSAAWAKAQQEAEAGGKIEIPAGSQRAASDSGKETEDKQAAMDQEKVVSGTADDTTTPVHEPMEKASVAMAEDAARTSAEAASVNEQVEHKGAAQHDDGGPQSTPELLPAGPAVEQHAAAQEAIVQAAEHNRLMDRFMLGATLQVKEMDGMVILEEKDAADMKEQPSS